VLWGTSKSTSFRLWTRAPRTTMLSVDIGLPERGAASSFVGTPQELPQQLPNLSIIREATQWHARGFNEAAKTAAWKSVSAEAITAW